VPPDELVAGPMDCVVSGVVDGMVDGMMDGAVLGSVVAEAEPVTGAADEGVAVGDEEQPAKARHRQPKARSLLAPQAVTATELARF
jgi:hypothetical protein